MDKEGLIRMNQAQEPKAEEHSLLGLYKILVMAL